MKYRLFLVTVSLIASCSLSPLLAQTDLKGRIYHNPNIMADAMKKEIDNSWTEAKSQAIAKIEKEKGRKMTDEEKAEFNKKEPEARKKMNEVMNGMRIGITVEFKSDKQAVMKLDMKMNDEVMKQAGIGWVKRKAMQAAMAVLPSSEKVEYVVKNNLVIFDPDDEPDTLRLSDDGKFIFGKFEKKTDFKLTRTK